jgi:chitinase
MAQVAKYVDYVCLMTYNFNSNGLAGGHFLYTQPGWDAAGSVDGAVKGFMAAGVPKNKLVIGAGFFPAALQMSTSDPQDRHFTKKINFRGGLFRMSKLTGYQHYWDSIAKAPFLFNRKTRVRIAYEDTASVDAKWQYIKNQHLAGLMYWDYFSDPGRKLLHRLGN